MAIRRHEWPLTLLMSAYLFLVIATFWLLKPLKKALFITQYDQGGLELFGLHLGAAEAEVLAKELNILVALVASTAFTWLARHLRRQQLSVTFSAFFIAGFAGYAFVLQRGEDWVAWSFYLFGDLYSTLMVATFFAFLNDSVTPQAAKRLYGVIVLGGVGGGVFGSAFVAVWVGRVTVQTWMWICAAVTAAVAALAVQAGRRAVVPLSPVARTTEPVVPAAPPAAPPATPHHWHSATVEGARLVLRSRYLLAVVAMVALYEMVSTTLDFQFSATVAHHLNGVAIERHFARMFSLTNVASLLVQLFLTSPVMTQLSAAAALLVTPLAIFGATGAFFAVPRLWPGSLLNLADNAFAYSINQSAREALYTVTSTEEKYRAKAFIDMFVQRVAKGLAGLVSLAFAATFVAFGAVRWLSVFSMLMLFGWMRVARYAGHQFEQRAHDGSGRPPPAQR